MEWIGLGRREARGCSMGYHGNKKGVGSCMLDDGVLIRKWRSAFAWVCSDLKFINFGHL